MRTPWGNSDFTYPIEPGLTWVGTPSHGGFIAKKDWAVAHLSDAAREEGEQFGGYIAFEEDCACSVVLVEFPHSAYTALFCNTPIEKIDADARHSIAFWLPIYAIKMGLPYSTERANKMAQEGWYSRAEELKGCLDAS
jgi:hypothetical protein